MAPKCVPASSSDGPISLRPAIVSTTLEGILYERAASEYRGLRLGAQYVPWWARYVLAQPSQSTFAATNAVYTAQTLLGDGILVRCEAARFMPVYRAMTPQPHAVVSILSVHFAAVVPRRAGTEFLQHVGRCTAAFYSLILVTNFIVSVLLGYKIRVTDRRFSRMRHSSLPPVVRIIADAGVLCSATLTASLACSVHKSNGQHLVL
ncbi:hypothetical protein BD414DRAFT_550745 [Trametes punicea]|nr:hypothetical protein BD414DRAFT_550745 [Trametes punicea]